jgi:alpha,alpha-trehalase
MELENLLSSIRRYGFVPNGGRDYYLSRSQPPFISSLVREVYQASLKKAGTAAEKARLKRWLRERAFPLIRSDYEKFWMNPKTRFDSATGLNHYWDDLDLPRPERHGSDNELALGKTYRDTRAAAESGQDFTASFGNEASRVASPLLNAMLFKTEEDLAWAATELGMTSEANHFQTAAARRRAAVDRFLWNGKKGCYEPMRLSDHQRIEVVSAESYAPLFTGMASAEQAAKTRTTLSALEKPGGVMATDLTNSPHQWDGPNGWAPYQVMAAQGLKRYGYTADAQRIADKWVHAVADVYDQDKTFYERIDVQHLKRPKSDANKYPPQEGFLWTNASYVWALREILNVPITPIHP